MTAPLAQAEPPDALAAEPAADYGDGASLVARRWTIAAVVVGIGLRLAQYLSNQSFWQDESSLLLNLRKFSASHLPFVRLDAVDSTQAAPPLMLLWFKGVTAIFGHSELALRLLPLLLAMLGLLVFVSLARRILPPLAVPWAAWMMALSDNLIFESATMKQYSADVLLAMLILGVGLVWDRQRDRVLRLLRASFLTAVSLWISYTSLFAFAAVALAIMPEVLRDRRKWKRSTPSAQGHFQYLPPPVLRGSAGVGAGGLGGGIPATPTLTLPRSTGGGENTKMRWDAVARFVLAMLPATVSFLAVYFASMRVQRDLWLVRYWSDRFVPWSHPLRVVPWIFGRTLELYRFPFWPVGQVLIIPAAVGVWILRRRVDGPIWRALILMPLLALAAAAVQAYPYGGTRVTLYLTPFLAMLAAAGIAGAPAHAGPRLRLAWRIIWLAMIAPMVIRAGYCLYLPRMHGDARAAVAFVRSHHIAGEPVYSIEESTSDDLQIYWPDAGADLHLMQPATAQFSDRAFWVVLAYNPSKFSRDYRQVLAQRGAVEDPSNSFHARGCDAVYFRR